MIGKLKIRCGAQFTSKLEGMVTDLSVAGESKQAFSDYLESSGKAASLGIDLSVTVLTTGFWPTYKTDDLALTEDFTKCVEVFREHYVGKSGKHRRLAWVYQLGTASVQGTWGKKKYDFQVTTPQAVVLLLFNNSTQMSFSEIQKALNIPEEDVKRLLHSLACVKHKLILKEPDTKSLSTSDTFTNNEGFTCNMRRIKIPMPPVDERKKTQETVDQDRGHAIEAAVVRIMKSRKVLNHQQLIAEVTQQLMAHFRPDVKVTKKRIENLIAREYLERDPDNHNTFRYLA